MTRKKSVSGVAKVEDNPDLIRDFTSNAIINKSNTGFQKRRAQINASKAQQEIDTKQREDIDTLKHDMQQIKQLLTKLVGDK
tara:strand:- start:7302 stop:7547 length:246 start_codon:yes stop_codon:yes gene_type:complete